MSGTDLLRYALRGLAVNRLRSALAMLGILLGVAATVLLTAVGNGSATPAVDRSGTLIVRGGDALTLRVADSLDDPLLAPGVDSVSPVVSVSATLSHGSVEQEVGSFLGTTPAWFAAADAPVASGAAFTAADEAQARRVVVIGRGIAETLFPGTDPVGLQVTADGALFTVIGVLEATGRDTDGAAIAPISAVRQVLAGYGPLSAILVRARDAGRVDTVRSELGIALNQRVEPGAYRIENSARPAGTRTGVSTVLGVVAVAGLLAGGLGITTVMLLAVTERTREIGLRKALGASRRAVFGLFVTEAVLLSVIGAVAGVAVAAVGSRFPIAGVEPVLALGPVATVLGAAVLIGLVFGALPAARAARRCPADALRHE